MRMIFDTKQKTIQIQEGCNLMEFIDEVKRLLPNEWQNYSLVPEVDHTYPFYVTSGYVTTDDAVKASSGATFTATSNSKYV